MTMPRPTVRARLTALYAALFGGSVAALMGVSYWILGRQLDRTLPEDLVAQALAELRTQYVLGFVGTQLIAVALGWVFAGRALLPLSRMTRAARRVTEERLDERISLDGPRDELRELAETYNAMLDRLADSFEAQRRFIANASHELRSPLTVIRAEAEVALANPDEDPAELRQVAEVVVEATKRTEALLEGLMMLARSQRALLASEPLELDGVARAAARSVSSEARQAGVRLELHLDAVSGSGDRRLLERLVANLLENGVRYNRRGGWVTLNTVANGEAVIRVANSGPVVDVAAAERLDQPFQRLGRDAEGTGAGLGLSIVRSVAEVHGGSVDFAPRPEGGLDVEVRLPNRAG